MFQRLLSIARVTFIETMRQPIYGAMLIATVMFLVLNVALSAFTLDDDDKLLLDLELSTLLLSGLFLAAFSAAGVLTREIENKTVLTVISKPVGRPAFLIGKFVGLFGALAVAYYICFLVFVLCIRHGVLQNSADPWDAPVLCFGGGAAALALVVAAFCNYFYHKEFPTLAIALVTGLLTIGVLLTAVLDEEFNAIPFASNFVGGQVIIAAYLVLLILMMMAAVAVAAATRFGQLMTLVICLAILGLGVIADNLWGHYEETSLLAAVAYRATPNVGPFWIIDGLISDSPEAAVGVRYLLYTTSYAILITVGVLSLGIAAFQTREVG